ncbi:MAG: UDP-N-acetylmuramoyl-L-alanyl-D-glutamate--2,6-diaminopimelate ligase [Pelovirga sp.]
MKLQDLLSAVSPTGITGPADLWISQLVCDSRNAVPQCLFFALPGTRLDGRHYIAAAVAGGAVAVVAESFDGVSFLPHCCFVEVADVRTAMAKMATHFYGAPGRGIPVIGVTGTNGKTTVTYLLEAILQAAGYQPAVFGTVDYRLGQQMRLPASHTTPESIDLMRILAGFRAKGADALIMEVSSHALEQHRVDGLEFTLAVFTNLTPEHLDYHPDMEHYFASKRRLFTRLVVSGGAVINADDAYGARLLAELDNAVSYGMASTCSLFPQQLQVGRDGIHGTFSGVRGDVAIDSPMIGQFNVSNLLAAVAAAQQLQIGNAQIARGVAQAPQVPGRLERVHNPQGVLALVDYAHTGDALEQALKTLSRLAHRKLYTLVGCGGDRDPGKRPLMAAVAVKYSDLAIFTSDNPRTEDPLQILAQIRAGALAAGSTELDPATVNPASKGFVVIPERRTAIEFAARCAQQDDLLLVAGKGHEDYQILGTRRIHFDDREELHLALQKALTTAVPGDQAHV